MVPWSQIQFFFSDHIDVPLPEKHRFPMEKYQLLRESLLSQEILSEGQLYEGEEISQEDLCLAHDEEYIQKVLDLTLETKRARKIGLPLTPEMILRARVSNGAFQQAVDSALEKGLSGTLAGGTHHAMKAEGEGYCFFNDFAVAVRRVHKHFPNKKILILDLDVHQGNGNSDILMKDKNLKIVSFHGKNNYPYRKIPSHIDIEFENGTTDETYLERLDSELEKLKKERWDLILYQAGVDNLEQDKLGLLSLTLEGLYQRDLQVFKFAKNSATPICFAIGGGYSDPIITTVEGNTLTFQAAKKIFD